MNISKHKTCVLSLGNIDFSSTIIFLSYHMACNINALSFKFCNNKIIIIICYCVCNLCVIHSVDIYSQIFCLYLKKLQ